MTYFVCDVNVIFWCVFVLVSGVYDVAPVHEGEGPQITTYEISSVLNDNFLGEVKKETSDFPVEQICTDLSLFKQSEDLDQPINLPILTPALNQLLHFLKSKVRTTVETLFKLKTRNKITATVSKYSKGGKL